jgi:hypothetical protein
MVLIDAEHEDGLFIGVNTASERAGATPATGASETPKGTTASSPVARIETSRLNAKCKAGFNTRYDEVRAHRACDVASYRHRTPSTQ